MSLSFAQLKRCRYWFTCAFTASFIILLVSSLFLSFNVVSHSERLNLAIAISVTSLFTSAASLAGLFLVYSVHVMTRKSFRVDDAEIVGDRNHKGPPNSPEPFHAEN